MFTLFLFGTFWFWALLFVTWVFITWFSENDRLMSATFTFLITACLLQWFGKIQLFQAVWNHPKEDFLYLIGYLFVGLLFALYKWRRFVKEITISEKRYQQSSLLQAPDVDSHSSRIIGWMMYWPFNIIWTLINDPIRWLFRTIFNETKAIFQRVSNGIVEKANKELQAKFDAEKAEKAAKTDKKPQVADSEENTVCEK